MGTGGVRIGLVAFIALGFWALGAPPATAADALQVEATVDGASLKEAGANRPIELRPTDNTIVAVKVTNNGSSPVDIRSVRLNARVLGLAFFSYTTRVDLTVEPGATGTRTFSLDLTDLEGQATGLLPAELSLLAPDRTVLASEEGTVDVKGKIKSVYGVFGIAVAAITGVLLLSLILRLFRRSLPSNRWSRALRFAVPGLGLGLVATFTLGVLRIAVPSLSTSLGLLIGGLVIGFVLGYLTPNPDDEADRDELDERDVVAAGAPVQRPAWAGAPAGPQDPPTAPIDSRTTAPAGTPAPAPPAEPLPPSQIELDDPRQTRVVGPPQPPTA